MNTIEKVQHATRRFEALAEPSRLQIIAQLFHGAATITSLAEVTRQEIPVATRELEALLEAELVVCRREGQVDYYSLHPDVVGLEARDSTWPDPATSGVITVEIRPSRVTLLADGLRAD